MVIGRGPSVIRRRPVVRNVSPAVGMGVFIDSGSVSMGLGSSVMKSFEMHYMIFLCNLNL